MTNSPVKISSTDFEAACGKTIDKWDLQTLLEYATERMSNGFKPGDWVVIGPDGAFEEGFRLSAVSSRARALAIQSAETLTADNGELYFAHEIGE